MLLKAQAEIPSYYSLHSLMLLRELGVDHHFNRVPNFLCLHTVHEMFLKWMLIELSSHIVVARVYKRREGEYPTVL